MGNTKSTKTQSRESRTSTTVSNPREAIKSLLGPDVTGVVEGVTGDLYSYFLLKGSSSKGSLQDFERWIGSQSADVLVEHLERVTGGGLMPLLRYLYGLAIASGTYTPIFETDHIDDVIPTMSLSTSDLFRLVFPCLLERSSGVTGMFARFFQQKSHPTSGQRQGSRVLSDFQLWLLSNCSMGQYQYITSNMPTLLFSLCKHGQSWVRFVNQVDLYPAPILLCISTKAGEVFGAWIDGGLKESGTKYFGSSQTLLFALSPKLTTCPTSGSSENYTLLNLKSQFVPTGLAFGGSETTHRLRLNSNLRTVAITYSDRTYGPGELIDMRDEDGSLMFTKEVDMDDMEMWGFGDREALRTQTQARDARESMRADARQVDRAKLMDNDFDREMFGGSVKVQGDRAEEVKMLRDEYRGEQRAKAAAKQMRKRSTSS